VLWKKCLGFSIYFMIGGSVLAKNVHLVTEEGFVNVEGGRVWYQVISAKKNKNALPLLVLHGGPGVPHTYLNVLKALASERPVIFYDQLGCGRSAVEKNDNRLWNLTRFERELETLVTKLRLNKFHLLGHSWGAALASEYAVKHPERLQSLILASPLLSTDLWQKDARKLIAQLAREVQSAILTNEAQGTTESQAYVDATEVYYHHFCCRMDVWPTDLSDALDHLNLDVYKTMWGPSEFTMNGNLKDFDQIPKLKALRMPMLITGGRFDEARPETLSYVVSQLSHAELITYEQSAHVAFLEEKEKYLSDLRQFIQRTENVIDK